MRIGIVNDVALAREALRRVVLSTAEHEVAWMATDGSEAVAMARADRPDLILMDLLMPHVDGVEAIRRIMGESPCAILVVTASVSGHLSKVYQAMGYGALDAVDTPILGQKGEIAGAVVLLQKIEIIGRLIGKTGEPPRGAKTSLAGASAGSSSAHGFRPTTPLIVIGASTGGPQALAAVLAGLPPRMNAAVIIVQHVDSAFAPGLGEWLSEQSQKPVAIITDGRTIMPGDVLLSGTDDHLILSDDGRLYYTVEPRELSYRPSVDVFFSSLARAWPNPGVAVLLTGMGRDGAAGLLELRGRGWRTIAQDESTSVVWGMPKAAITLGAAESVLPLSQIARSAAGFISAGVAETRRSSPKS